MSESRVPENGTHGLNGGRWESDTTSTEMGDEPSGLRPTSRHRVLTQRPTSPMNA